MEAARPPEKLGPERELLRLRPFGEAYVMRNFGEQLDFADAEDAVSDVTLRLHRQIAKGKLPENLQGAFLTGCRNAAIDRLRRRARKPTVAIEAAADSEDELPRPDELAERGEHSARGREVLARLIPRHRRVLMLRFGMDLSVPEIADQMQISLVAAKNLLGRATAAAREQLEALEGSRFCPEVQELLRCAVIDRQIAGLADEDERRVLDAHLDHCGTCKSFLAAMHRNLNEIGSGALLATTSAHHFAPLAQLGDWFERASAAAHAAGAKLRLAALKTSAALNPDPTSAGGALAGTGQKLIAVCGAATATTCLAAGIVGPGVGVLAQNHGKPVSHHNPPTQVRRLSELPTPTSTTAPIEASSEPEPQPVGEADAAQQTSSTSSPEPSAASESSPSPPEQAAEEFGVESTAPPAATPAPASSPPPTSSSASSSEGGAAHSSGGESFGFGG